MIEQLFATVLASCTPHSFPVVIPEDTALPAATYTFVGMTATPTFSTSGLNRYRVEVSCYGNNYTDAATLRATITAALNGYQDHNMTITKANSFDLHDYELLQFRSLVEFYVLSVL